MKHATRRIKEGTHQEECLLPGLVYCADCGSKMSYQTNLAPMGSAILFEVADKGVNFLDELELSAEDAFSASAPRMGRPNAREEAATDFIRSLLAGGRRLASDCEAKLEAAGFKKSTYKKSKKKAGVRSVKDGFLWYWTLPEVEKPIENGQEVTDEDDLPV